MNNEKEVIEYIKNHYIYSPLTGEIRNRKQRVVKGSWIRGGYKKLNIRIGKRRHDVCLHRVAWALVYGRFPQQIDHINGIKTDNRLENLREVTVSENLANRLLAWNRTEDKIPGVFASAKCHAFEAGGKRFFSKSPHACFHDLTTLGRMFEEQSGDALTVAEETEREVLERLSALKDDDKRAVAEQLFRYVNYLESVQQMPLLLRLKFYEVVVPVYNFLRKNKQLARHEGAFTTPVRMFIHQLMSKSTQRGRFSLCTFPVGAIRSTQREPSPLCTSNKLSNGKLSNCK